MSDDIRCFMVVQLTCVSSATKIVICETPMQLGGPSSW